MRMHRGWKGACAIGVAMMLVTAGAVSGVWASHTFSDVPDSNPFHDDIAAINEACIGGGFPDGTFRPGNNVTRQAMAAFLARTGSEVAYGSQTFPVDVGSASVNSEAPYEDVASVTIDVPDLPDCQQHVVLEATATVFINDTAANSCNLASTGVCNGYLSVWEGANLVERSMIRLNNNRAGGTVSVVGTLPAAPGIHTYTLKANSMFVKVDKALVQQGRIFVTRVPFGPAPVIAAPGVATADPAVDALLRGETP